MTYSTVTKEYYAKWLAAEPAILDESGIFFIHSPSRNEQPAGYPERIDIFTYVTPHTVIVSYSDISQEKIPQLKSKILSGMASGEIRDILTDVYHSKVEHNIKYVYSGEKFAGENLARQLTPDDFSVYLSFFRAAHPNCKDTSWLNEYFYEIAEKGYCHGVMVNGELASVADAPDMPFMSDKVQEIGINTLLSYQGRGYAKSACLSLIRAIIIKDICPQWSTTIQNIASQRLAVAVGFQKYFDCLNVSLS